MKVFVYTKNRSRKVAIITNVTHVYETDDKIFFITEEGIETSYDKRQVKTTCFQN